MHKSLVVMGAAVLSLAACRPSEILDVPPPLGILTNANTQGGAEAIFAGQKIQLFNILGSGLIQWTSVLSDEFTWTAFEGYYASQANVDARQTTAVGGVYQESGDQQIEQLLAIRSVLLIAVPALEAYRTDSAKVGEAYAMAGYIELLLAEDYCAGVPISNAVVGGGVQYGPALTTDTLLQLAQTHFDSAIKHADGSATVLGLANTGLARALLNRAKYDSAAAAATNVPTSFVYNVELAPTQQDGGTNFYVEQDQDQQGFGCGYMNVADVEGGNGLNYRSANDPRLLFDSLSSQTCDALGAGISPGKWYYPLKFENAPSYIPLATGIEARLMEAEAALADNEPSVWLADLNALRTNGMYTIPTPGDTVYTAGTGAVAGLAPLTDPGTDSSEVALMFRERAFWLFGTGTRLGDMRRLVRQYGSSDGFTVNGVYPVGAYPTGPNATALVGLLTGQGLSPLTQYGTDVSLTLPTAQANNGALPTQNPGYKGCLTSPATV